MLTGYRGSKDNDCTSHYQKFNANCTHALLIYVDSIKIDPFTPRVKSGIFGQTAKFGQRPCLFHISNIGSKNKLTKQTVKIQMRRHKEPSHLDLHCLQICVRIYLMSEFT